MSVVNQQEAETGAPPNGADVRSKLPPGFKQAPQDYAPNLSYDRFTQGVVATYLTTREPGKGAKNMVHTFSDGERFEVWGCASLDIQLESAKRGQRVFLLYEGKAKSGANEVHKWIVGLG